MNTSSISSSNIATTSILLVLLVFFCSIASAQVWEEWSARYGAGVGEYATAEDIAVDIAGNVYVTGGIYFDPGWENYVTIKYTADGVQQWVTQYNGPANDDDFVEGIAVDADGNVYITGWSLGVGTAFDFATIKYDTNGIEQWVARYDGPSNDYDYAFSLVVDEDGYVYVTGQSDGIGTNVDFATIKYDSDGVEQWVARYNSEDNDFDRASSITVDVNGNVLVTGDSAVQNGGPCPTDLTTVKYNSAGVQQWVRNFNSIGDGYHGAVQVVTDAAGNVYVAGAGGSFASFPYNYDFHTIMYSSAGDELWVASYNGPGDGWDFARSLGVGADGNVYVLGQSRGIDGSLDYTTIKYSTTGQEQWVARYETGDTGTNPSALTLDVFGGIYVTGECSNDFMTIKYDPDGTELWAIAYNGPDDTYDVANAITTDLEGYVYVTGYSSEEMATVKFGQEHVTPALLSSFDLSAADGGVRIRWELATASDTARFRLVRQYEGTEIELDWTSSAPGSFEGVDNDPRLREGGTFYYRLYSQLGNNIWQLLQGETLTLKTLPQALVLHQARPNPFNPQTTVSCSLAQAGPVRITVHDLKGHHVATLFAGVLPAGEHDLEWSGQDASGCPVDSGIYLIHLEAPGSSQSQKVVLVK